MMEEDMDVSIKVIIVGNGQVGKTSLITRFAKGIMTETYKKTIGTDFMEKEITVRRTGEQVKLMLWDTAGQEMFSKLTRQYYRGAGACVLVFSSTDRESFMAIEQWRSKVAQECGDDCCHVLVQNKCDLLQTPDCQVSADEVEELAQRLGLKLYRICVKENQLVDDVFDYLADSFLAQDHTAPLLAAATSKDAAGPSQPQAVASAKEIAKQTSLAAASAAQPKPASALLQGTVAASTQPSLQTSNHIAVDDKAQSSTSGKRADGATSLNSSDKSPSIASPNGSKGSKGKSKDPNVVSLQPLTQRTGGKKKTFCTIL